MDPRFPAFKRAVTEYRKLYQQAKEQGKDQFIFQGQDVLTQFAYYHLQYLEDLVKKGRIAT